MTTVKLSLPVVVSALRSGIGGQFFTDVLLAALFGGVAGLAIGVIRRWYKVKSKVGESFTSALMSRRLFAVDDMFIPSVFISGVAGLIVASIVGAGSASEVQKLVWEGYHQTLLALYAVVAGGSGGPPLPVAGSYWMVLLVLLIILLQALLLGAAVGAVCYVVAGVVTGAAKGSSKGLFRSAVEGQEGEHHKLATTAIMVKNAYRGAFEGGVTGAIVGTINAIIAVLQVDSKNLNDIFLVCILVLTSTGSAIFSFIRRAADAIGEAGGRGQMFKMRTDPRNEGTLDLENFNDVNLNCPFCGRGLVVTRDHVKAMFLKCPHCHRVVFGNK